MTQMTRRQVLFCRYYVAGMGKAEAAVKAGYAERSAGMIACENLRKPYIVAHIKELQREQDQEIEVTCNLTRKRIIEEYMAIAFIKRSDIQDAFDANGNLKKNIPPHVDAAIQSVGVRRNRYGIDLTVSCHDKTKALDRLLQIMGWDRSAEPEGDVHIHIGAEPAYDPEEDAFTD